MEIDKVTITFYCLPVLFTVTARFHHGSLEAIFFSSPLQYILNELEVKVKTELWTKQNAEYLQEQKGGRK